MYSKWRPSDGTPRFISFWQWFLHGSRTWSRLMIDTGVWCRRFIKTVQVQMIHTIDRMNLLWVPAQEFNTTFYKLFALVLHGSRTWSRQMIDAGARCRRFIKTVQVQMIHKVDRINVFWVPAQESNTTFYKLFAMASHGSRAWSVQMIDAGDWCRWFIKTIQVHMI